LSSFRIALGRALRAGRDGNAAISGRGAEQRVPSEQRQSPELPGELYDSFHLRPAPRRAAE
jgi:hypothetical protein